MSTVDILRDATRRLSDEQLIAGLRLLDRGDVDADERTVRAVICDVLEERHPHVVEALEAWLDDASFTRSYASALLAALTKES